MRGRQKGNGKGQKNYHKTIDIFVEGESELQYLKMLQRKYGASNILRIKQLSGKKGPALVSAVKGQLSNNSRMRAEEVYLMFDRDDLTVDEIKTAERQAKMAGYQMIFSSIDFEVFILLHFKAFSRSYTRPELMQILSGAKYFNQDYKRFKGSEYDKYLIDKVATAVKNAKALNKNNPGNLATTDPYLNIQEYIRPIFGRED